MLVEKLSIYLVRMAISDTHDAAEGKARDAGEQSAGTDRCTARGSYRRCVTKLVSLLKPRNPPITPPPTYSHNLSKLHHFATYMIQNTVILRSTKPQTALRFKNIPCRIFCINALLIKVKVISLIHSRQGSTD